MVLVWTFYLAMVVAGYLIELVFAPSGLVPTGPRNASVGDAAIKWNYTTVLNILFLLLSAVLVWRFLRTGGQAMLSMMGGGPDDMADHSGHIGPATSGSDS